MPFSRFLSFSYITILLLLCVVSLLGISNKLLAAEATTAITECPIPTFDKINSPLITQNDKKMVITSKKTTLDKNQIAIFSGDVTLVSGQQSIVAQSLEFDRASASFKALGNIQFQNDSVNIFANNLTSSKDKQATTLSDTSYQLSKSLAHGSANEINIRNAGSISLVGASFTTCYEETPAWQLRASEINISSEENFGEAYNARLHILDVPVLYIPYFSFPVTNQRKTGFLYPSIGSSSKLGATVETPFYWNIAENIDATFTPKYMSNIGTQLLSEFRYLSGEQSGEVHIEYLDSDKEYKSNDARYLTRIQHTGTFSDNFRAHVDTTTISDDSYLVDIGSQHYNSNDAYLYQTGELSYFANAWNITGKLQDFEVLGDNKTSYQTVPQLELNSRTPLNWLNASFNINSEIAQFKNDNNNLPEAERYHMEAGFVIPIATPAWFLNSEFKLLQTHYHQSNIEHLNSEQTTQLKSSVDRTLPKVRLHGGMNFDRDMNLLGYTQTLEPQLQYLYIENKDQSAIALYDTAPLQDDYAGLFRDKRFSGLDRIAEANQYSWGITSRILNPSNDEIFRLSLGRIVYLNDSDEPINVDTQLNEKSALAAETFFQMNNQWQLSGNIQYNTNENITNKSQFNIDYQQNEFLSSQLNHRYIRDVSGVSLEQLSLLSNVKLNKDWRFIGRISQDLQEKRSIESYAGFQYESCCWAVRFAYHRHIDSSVDETNINNDNLGEFESGFMIQFVIKGLNGQNTSLNSDDMLNTSIFGYKRPYFLNN